MTENIVWNKNSLIDLSVDSIAEYVGTATLDSGTLTLGAQSSATFNYIYDTTSNIVKATNLKFVLEVINSNTEVSSRYNDNIQLDIYINYYKELLNDAGEVTGYEINGVDTYQINPYFKHEKRETLGYTTDFKVDIVDTPLATISINYINNSDDEVKFSKVKLFNSMTIIEAIKEYGGGEDDSEMPPPSIDALRIYNVDNKYTIDGVREELILNIFVPDKCIVEVGDNSAFNRVAIDMNAAVIDGDFDYSLSAVSSSNRTIDGVEYAIFYSQYKLKCYGNGKLKLKASLNGNAELYTEKVITIINNNLIDMSLKIHNDDGNIHGTEWIPVTLAYNPALPEDDGIVLNMASYDNEGTAQFSFDGQTGYTSLASVNGPISGYKDFYIRGLTNGQVQFTAKTYNVHNKIRPVGFTKTWILNVFDAPEPIISIKSSTGINKVAVGGTLNLTADWVNAPSGITKKYEWLINNIDSTASVTKSNGDNNRTYITVTGKAVGRVYIVCKDYTTLETYATYELEVVENIDEYALPVLTSDTGDFVIDTASGELIITPSHATETVFTYEQMYVDGGEVIIEEYDNYCKLIGKEDGTTRLKVTTASGLNVYQNVIVSNQYPQGVSIVTSDGSTTVEVGGTINVFAKPSNNVDTRYDLYSWTYEKIDNTAEVSLNELVDGQVEVTGVTAGQVRVVCISVQNGSILASIELEVIDEIPELISDTWDLDMYDDGSYGNVVAASQIIVTPKHSTETVFTYKQLKGSGGEISIESFGNYCVVTGVKEGGVYLYVETSKGIGTKKYIYVNRHTKDGIYDNYDNTFTVDGSREDPRLLVFAIYKKGYSRGFEFTEVYTDESIIDIITKDDAGKEFGDMAIIRGKKDGITTLRVYQEDVVDELITITVKNITYSANVFIQTSSEKVLIDGTITALADVYDDNHNWISEVVESFIWGYDIVDSLAEVDIQYEKDQATVTGKALGKVRLTCICKDESRFYIGSKIIEVVESL